MRFLAVVLIFCAATGAVSLEIAEAGIPATSCNEIIETFFPKNSITSVFGYEVRGSHVPYLTPNTERCVYSVVNPTSTSKPQAIDQIHVSVGLTDINFKISCPASGLKPKIGDQACINDHSGQAKKNNYFFEIATFVFQYNPKPAQLKKTSNEVEKLLAYAVSKVQDLGGPVIDTFTPKTVVAGEKIGHDEKTGLVTYRVSRQPFEIAGKNLAGALITSDHRTTDGSAALIFTQVKVSNDGNKVNGFINVSDKAKDGKAKITLANSAGKSVTAEILISITGTQYLKRKFSNQKISFYGDWPDLMPNSEALRVESEINEGLAAINKPTYKKLNLAFHVYEYENLWKKYIGKPKCGSDISLGCASNLGKDIYVSTQGEFRRHILHESAHKLHASYIGIFEFIPFVHRFSKSQLTLEWERAIGDLSLCDALPLKDPGHWKNGEMLPPRCGFAWAYGASDSDIKQTFPFSEDIATLVEFRKFRSGILKTGDALTDKRYELKYAILDKYGF
jgi:hypothetical protein